MRYTREQFEYMIQKDLELFAEKLNTRELECTDDQAHQLWIKISEALDDLEELLSPC